MGSEMCIRDSSNGDRIAVAAQMYHAGKVERIILTGKNIVEIHGSEFSEPSKQAKELLISLGVDPDRLDEAGGRNTYEEMQSLAERLDPNQRIGLITSAWHLPRSLRRAKGVGLKVIPVPSDFATGEVKRSVLQFIPSYGGINNSSLALREYLGMAVGR